jgi:dTDP-4-amino-4,6-dideoxygalactose transaminase
MVKFFDMELANKNIDLKRILNDVSNSYQFSLGDFVSTFEHSFSSYIGSEYCVGVANGTDGLELAMLSVGITEKDTILTVSNAGFYASTAANAIGASVEYIDVNDEDLLINLDLLQNFIEQKNKIKAIVVTHLFGQVVDMERVLEIVKNTNIKLIEDCSHAHGSSFKDKKVGTFADVGVFSFYPTKNLGAVGDGGAVVTNDSEIYERLLSLRQYGWSSKYFVSNKRGRNSRLDAIQAAVLSEKLAYLDAWNNMRLSIANKYSEGLKNLPLKLLDKLKTDSPHLYPIRTSYRDNLKKFLINHNIQTEVHYPIPDHKQKIININHKNLDIS